MPAPFALRRSTDRAAAEAANVSTASAAARRFSVLLGAAGIVVLLFAAVALKGRITRRGGQPPAGGTAAQTGTPNSAASDTTSPDFQSRAPARLHPHCHRTSHGMRRPTRRRRGP